MLLRKITSIGVVSLAVIAGAQIPSKSPMHLTGYITDTWCGVNRDTKPPTKECTETCVRSEGAKYAFYDKASGKVFIVQNPQAVASLAGANVEIEGVPQKTMTTVKTMRGERQVDTIAVVSVHEIK